MVRLTAETIENAYDFLNTCKQRELSLRGMQIPAIENLGVTRVGNLEVTGSYRLKYLSASPR